MKRSQWIEQVKQRFPQTQLPIDADQLDRLERAAQFCPQTVYVAHSEKARELEKEINLTADLLLRLEEVLDIKAGRKCSLFPDLEKHLISHPMYAEEGVREVITSCVQDAQAPVRDTFTSAINAATRLKSHLFSASEELQKDLNITNKGDDGENTVESHIRKNTSCRVLSNVVLPNPQKDANAPKTAESDLLVFCERGVLVCEIKNYGTAGQTLEIQPDGEMLKTGRSGKVLDYLKSPFPQTAQHCYAVKNVLEAAGLADIPVLPVTVIANTEVYIENNSHYRVMDMYDLQDWINDGIYCKDCSKEQQQQAYTAIQEQRMTERNFPIPAISPVYEDLSAAISALDCSLQKWNDWINQYNTAIERWLTDANAQWWKKHPSLRAYLSFESMMAYATRVSIAIWLLAVAALFLWEYCNGISWSAAPFCLLLAILWPALLGIGKRFSNDCRGFVCNSCVISIIWWCVRRILLMAVTVIFCWQMMHISQIANPTIGVTEGKGLSYTLCQDGEGYCVEDVWYCTDTVVVIPAEYKGKPVTEISKSAFANCSEITNIHIPDSVTSIGSGAFSGCTNITSIHIPDSVTFIGNSAFAGCTKLESIALPPQITSVEESTFEGCDNLSNVTLGDQIKIIGSNAFAGCHSLNSILLPNGITTIEQGAFLSCENLANVAFPESVTFIGRAAFAECNQLTSIVLPESITGISDAAFGWCASLREIHIPTSVTEIGVNAFRCCERLSAIYYSGTHEQWYQIKKGNFWNDDAETFTIHCANRDVCYGPIIDQDGCGLCFELNDDGLGYCVVGIGICEDTDIVIPAEFRCRPVTSIRNNAFFNRDTIISITILGNVSVIESEAFYNCDNLMALVVKDGLNAIERRAFYGCKNLNNVTLGGTLETIGTEAFAYCSSLTEIVLQDGLQCIDYAAFLGCASLTQLEIPNSVTHLGESALANCNQLVSVVLPSGITEISRNLLNNATSLTHISIPASVTKISDTAFCNCKSLTEIEIPNSITYIGMGAFMNCKNLQTIRFGGTLEQWQDIGKEWLWRDNTGNFVVYCLDDV